MVQMTGKYESVSKENFAEFMTAVAGVPLDVAKTLASSKTQHEICQNGDQWSFILTSNGKTAKSNFTLGNSYDEYLPNGFVFKCLTIREGDTLKVTVEMPDGNQAYRRYQFTDTGMTISLSDKNTGSTSFHTYKRI